MSRVCVTGASGFIGRRLCECLRRRGFRVRALMRRPAEGPWDEPMLVPLGEEPLPSGLLDGVDTLFHLAGRAHAVADTADSEALYRAANVQSTLDLLDAGARCGLRAFVYFSSVKAIGEGGAEEQDETSPLRPTTPYGRTKLEAERAVLAAESTAHRVVLRPSLVYDPNPKGYLALMIRAASRGWLPPLPRSGRGRSMIHLDDLVEAACLVASDPRAAGRTYILTDGNAYTAREIYDAILSAAGRSMPGWSLPPGLLRLAARSGDLIGRLRGRRFLFDSDVLEKLMGSARYSGERIQRELGFSPSRNLIETMPEILESCRRPGAAN